MKILNLKTKYYTSVRINIDFCYNNKHLTLLYHLKMKINDIMLHLTPSCVTISNICYLIEI